MGCGSSKSTDTVRTSEGDGGNSSGRTATDDNDNRRQPTPEPTPEPRRNRTGESDFVKEALDAHNEYRACHGVPALRVADDLNAYSQQWADNIASRDTMEHSKCKLPSGGSVGENIYYCWSSDPSAGVNSRDAVKSWYDEIKDYNYNNATFSMGTGHFTQVVWKGTEEMGIAKAKSPKGSWFVVANYRPAGNMMGAFSENVLPRNN